MMFINRASIKKHYARMKIFGKKVGIASTSNRKEDFYSTKMGSLPLDEPSNIKKKESNSQKSKQLSPLSSIVSKFIADNARKTFDSIDDEQERKNFISDLRDTLKSVRDGTKRPPRRSLSKTSDVIVFFADTTENTLFSIVDEEERTSFEEHLTRSLCQNLQQEISIR